MLGLGQDGEIGYWVAPDARGQGYATETVRTLAAWGFERGVRRILIACDVRNLPSARTALAAGFAFEGVSRDAIASRGRPGVPEIRGELARFARLSTDPGAPIAAAFAALPPGGVDDGVLRMRATGPGDAHGLLETDDGVAVGWGFTGQAMSADEARLTTAGAGLDWLVGRAAQFTMVDMASGSYAGELRLRSAGPPQVGGVGYVVHPAFRGRGYTTRALRLLVSWAFGQADFARLELGAKPANIASQRAAAAAGFVPDGVREARLRNADGTFDDEIRFALVNPRHARAR